MRLKTASELGLTEQELAEQVKLTQEIVDELIAEEQAMLTQEQANDIRTRYDAFQAWVDTKRDKRSGWASFHPDEIPSDVPRVTNEEIGALEAFEFQASKPDRLFAYVKLYQPERLGTIDRYGQVTTWTGDKLGEIFHVGKEYRATFGDKRINIRVRAITGEVYSGTYYKSSGDYCRLRKVKG